MAANSIEKPEAGPTSPITDSSAQPARVLFYLCEQMLATSMTLPAEMLRAAENAARGKQKNKVSANIVTVAAREELIPTRSGLKIQPDAVLPETSSADIIFLPALWRNPLPIVRRNREALDWLQQAQSQGATIAGVGTGCCFMAAAGLLDNKAATTHWYAFDLFERHYPKVHLKRDYFITQVGSLYCAASINSLADLTVHFIQRIFSSDVAHHVERHFSHEIRKSYESLRYFDGGIDKHSDESVLQAQMWMQDHYADAILLSDVADRFDMSVRTFNRRFKQATGKSPLQYLQHLRLGAARDLLQATNLSISEIAYRVGYQDLGHFSELFKKMFTTTPHDYRTTVRAKLFSID